MVWIKKKEIKEKWNIQIECLVKTDQYNYFITLLNRLLIIILLLLFSHLLQNIKWQQDLSDSRTRIQWPCIIENTVSESHDNKMRFYISIIIINMILICLFVGALSYIYIYIYLNLVIWAIKEYHLYRGIPSQVFVLWRICELNSKIEIKKKLLLFVYRDLSGNHIYELDDGLFSGLLTVISMWVVYITNWLQLQQANLNN